MNTSAHERIRRLQAEVEELRAGSAKMVRALDASTQLIEALLAWLPEGQAMSPGLATAKETWTEAMREIYR